jgi:hypothetical protein
MIAYQYRKQLGECSEKDSIFVLAKIRLFSLSLLLYP